MFVQPAEAKPVEQFMLDRLADDQLSTFMFQNPNLQISAQRRLEIEAYRKRTNDMVL